MSTQKRIFSLLLSFVMIFSIITSAGITSFASDKPSFVFDVSDAYVGEEVEIKVSATDIIGLTAADLIFEYDQEAHLRQVAEEKMAEGYREGKIAGILDILAELGSVPDDVIRRIQSEKTFQY